MKKRRVNWAFGNPACAAWEVETAAGLTSWSAVITRWYERARVGARDGCLARREICGGAQQSHAK